MWTRKELKTRAKAVLKVSYWKAFLVSIILTITGSGRGTGGGFNFGFNGNQRVGQVFNEYLPFILSIMGLIIVVAIALRILITYPLEVGGRKYFLDSAQGEVNFNNLGYGFEARRYWDIIKALFWRDLVNFLWFLLLIIPGIIKAYAFRMVPYILAENPSIGSTRARELSEQMTDGHKFNIFILDLSFIGWYILGALTFGIGMFFVTPYVNATDAELYLSLRQAALEKGYCTAEELNLCC